MAIYVGLDVHRAQITYDALYRHRAGAHGPAPSGQPRDRSRIPDALGADETTVAVEAMTGWRFIAEECARLSIKLRLAEPAETRMHQDRKRRAKTDKLDARLLRELLMQQRLPESWIAPAHILDLRAKVRLRKTLVDQRTELRPLDPRSQWTEERGPGRSGRVRRSSRGLPPCRDPESLIPANPNDTKGHEHATHRPRGAAPSG